jgi:hypothetical protein
LFHHGNSWLISLLPTADGTAFPRLACLACRCSLLLAIAPSSLAPQSLVLSVAMANFFTIPSGFSGYDPGRKLQQRLGKQMNWPPVVFRW